MKYDAKTFTNCLHVHIKHFEMLSIVPGLKVLSVCPCNGNFWKVLRNFQLGFNKTGPSVLIIL